MCLWAFLLQQEDEQGWWGHFHQHSWIQKGISVHRTGLEQRRSSEVPSACPGSCSTPGEGSGKALPPLRCWTPPRMISSFGLKPRAVVPVTNTPDNASLQFYQNRFFGSELVHHLVLPTSFAANKMYGPSWLHFYPYRKGTGEKGTCQQTVKIGCPADPPEMRPPFLRACRHCPLVLLPWDIAGNIKEKL